jgi:transaldolase
MATILFEQISKLGQSIWYDNISRQVLNQGDLTDMIHWGEIRGITSNPSIFEKAITGGADYDDTIRAILQRDPKIDPKRLYEAIATLDIQAGADLLFPVYDESQGGDGYISLEVSPTLANDVQGTVDEAHRLRRAVNRPNLMIKVPATEAGLKAIEILTANGVSVNVTLIFSHDDWRNALDAYVRGLERRLRAGQDVRSIASVASFFISRIDSLVDKLLPDSSTAGSSCRRIRKRGLRPVSRIPSLDEMAGA